MGEERCPKSLANLLLLVRAALYGNAEISAARPQALAHLFHLDLYRLMRLLETLDDVVSRPGLLNASVDQQAEVDPMIEVANVLANWPRAFQGFLRKRYGDELEGDSSRRSFKLTFPWAFWTLGRNLKEHAHQLEFLRDEVVRFGACYWTQERLTRMGSRAALVGLHCEWGSVPDAASLIGLDPRTLLKRIEEGLVPIRESDTALKNRNYQVDLTWARKWTYSARASMGMREAAKSLGISMSFLSALRASRVYKTCHPTRRPGGYSVEDIAALKRVLDHAVREHSSDGSISGIMVDGRRLDQMGSPSCRARALHRLIGISE